MTTQNAEQTICTLAIYTPSSQTTARITALVSNFSNKMLDRFEEPNLDFSDDDAVEEALVKIDALINKHQAIPVVPEEFIPLKKCSKCAKLLDLGVEITNPDPNEPEGRYAFACWGCQQWYPAEGRSVQLRTVSETSSGITLTMRGDISRTEAGALLAMTAGKMEAAIIDGKPASGDITSPVSGKVGTWRVELTR